MFPRLLLRFAGLGLAIGLLMAVVPVPAWSQDRSTQERIDRLERDINMMQRQVYRGAPTATSSDPAAAANTEIRMERLESQMRDLTGRVEEVANQVEQLRQRFEQFNSDIDVRFNQAGIAAATGTAPTAPGPFAAAGRPAPRSLGVTQGLGRSDSTTATGGSIRGLMPGAEVPPPEPAFGTLTPPGTVSPNQDRAAVAAGAPLPSGSAAQQYNYAFGLLKQADYDGAEVALRAFLQQHPKDPMAANAQYWLGESYYARNKYIEAASAFAEGYKRYPKGSKAADELLKLGMALGHANQKQNACVALAQLDRDFPHPSAAIKERAAAEKKHLGCS